MSNGNFLPPDLCRLLSITRLPKLRTRVVSLSISIITQRQFDFELNEIKNLAWQLHDNLDRAFRGVVTEFALEKWEEFDCTRLESNDFVSE